jgi:hypothetical protein
MNKVCHCENDCDCITVQPGDEMNDVNSENFKSKMNLLDDREFDKAMKAIRAKKDNAKRD